LLVEQVNGEWNQPGAEQLDAGPSVHLSFERFQAVDVLTCRISSGRSLLENGAARIRV
jgi:hypothetical protein